MAYRHSEALTGVAMALSEIAKEAKDEGATSILKKLAHQVLELQGYWHNDEDAAELGRHGKRIPLKTEYKALHVGPRHTVKSDQMDDVLAVLTVEGWEILDTHADLTQPSPQWAILLTREVPA